MQEVGLWVSVSDDECFLIKKDANGYPDLVSLQADTPLQDVKSKKAMGKKLYESFSGKPYPHPNATTRQVLWDFLEMAIRKLP